MVEKIINGDFETGDLTGWISGGDASNPQVVTTSPHSGTYCCLLEPSDNQYLDQTCYDDYSGEDYITYDDIITFGFWYKNLSEEDNIVVDIYLNDSNDSFSVNLGNATSWTYIDLKAEMASNGYTGSNTLSELIINNPTSDNVYIDDVSLNATIGIIGIDVNLKGIFGEDIVNGGFETGNMNGWIDDWGAGNTNITSADKHSGTYSCKLDGDIVSGLGYIHQNLFIFWGDIQSFGIWFKNTSDQNANVEVLADYLGGTYYYITLPSGTTDWTYIDLKAEIISQGAPTNNSPIIRIAMYNLLAISTGTILLDDVSLITSTPTKTYDIDAEFSHIPDYNIDTIFKKFNVVKTYNIDVGIYYVNNYSIDTSFLLTHNHYLLDTLFKLEDITVDYLIDAKMTNPAQYFLDVQIKIPTTAYTKTYSNDLIIQKLGELSPLIDSYFVVQYIKTYDVDTVIKLEYTSPYSLDVRLYDFPNYSQIANSTDYVYIKPISVSESQDCKPAVRDIPLAQYQHIDDDTFVMSTRSLELTFRLSDDDKDTLQTIFNANEIVNIYLRSLDGTFGWYYVGWFREKSILFEYAAEETIDEITGEQTNYTRWWKVTATFDVKSFAYFLSSFKHDVEFTDYCDEYYIDYGDIIVDGETYDLPKTLNITLGSHTITYVPADGKTFLYWETTGEVSVEDEYSETTTITVTGNGGIVKAKWRGHCACGF